MMAHASLKKQQSTESLGSHPPKRAQSQCETKQQHSTKTIMAQQRHSETGASKSQIKKQPVPFLDLTKVIPNFSLERQQEQLKQYQKLASQIEECETSKSSVMQTT